MDKQLILIRIKSFAWSAGTLVVTALIGVLASDEFRTLVAEHLGTGALSTIGLLLLDAVVKHVRNIQLGKKLGAAAEKLYI